MVETNILNAPNVEEGRLQSRLTVLSISPFAEDHHFLDAALKTQNARVYYAQSCREAIAALSKDRVPVIICESDLPDGNWKDILGLIAPLPDPPSLVVSSSSADEHLWAEVLNLGGYDVLAKPFDSEEVTRVLAVACQKWGGTRNQEAAHAERKPVSNENPRPKTRTAGSA